MKNEQQHHDIRLEEISNLLIQYSLGNFEEQLPISDSGDDVDALIAGVNMLGEELKHVTFSRDFLNRVYNSIAEVLIVADLQGIVEDLNSVACKRLNANKYDIIGTNIFDHIVILGNERVTDKVKILNSKKDKMELDGELAIDSNVKLKCNFTTLRDLNEEPSGMLLIAEDVTDKIATEKLVIRTIIETQEKERNRFASDLHDSLGQQLSGIRFYISALQSNIENEANVAHFNKTLSSIDNAIAELRDICFNLMPRTLERHTLKFSLAELASKFDMGDRLKLDVRYGESVPELTKAFEIACFRIVQEFLNNAMKHGHANKVIVKFMVPGKSKNLSIELIDSGVGFDTDHLKSNSGMGLRNIKTRVESYFGSFQIQSKEGGGTSMLMKFPLAFITLQ